MSCGNVKMLFFMKIGVKRKNNGLQLTSKYSYIRNLIFSKDRTEKVERLFLPIIGDLTLSGILIFTVGLIILWLIVSIPVYLAGKFVTAGEATLGDAMVATLFGPIVYAITLFVINFLFGAVVGIMTAYFWALILAFIAWVVIFKASFRTGWLAALAISLLSVLIFAVISLLFGTFLGVMVPAPFFPSF
jgi:hypothetical protein